MEVRSFGSLAFLVPLHGHRRFGTFLGFGVECRADGRRRNGFDQISPARALDFGADALHTCPECLVDSQVLDRERHAVLGHFDGLIGVARIEVFGHFVYLDFLAVFFFDGGNGLEEFQNVGVGVRHGAPREFDVRADRSVDVRLEVQRGQHAGVRNLVHGFIDVRAGSGERTRAEHEPEFQISEYLFHNCTV